MYNHIQLAKKYIHYYLTAANGKGHGLHSPFIFDFVQNILNNKSGYTPPVAIEKLRQQLLHDHRYITIEDMGAGSRLKADRQRAISQIAATAVKPKKYGQLLYRVAAHYRANTLLELGTSLGITTAYMAAANPAARVITIEGSKAIAQQARQHFDQLSLTNIEAIPGSFDNILPELLPNLPTIDLAYIDGNHRYEPTLSYFEQLLQKHHNDTVLVFDDIHWSAEMEQAWKAVQQHPSVRCTIDLFFLGFVFFRQEFKEKQQVTIRF